MPSDLFSRFPNLSQFLGAYFHQDWTEDASSADDVVNAFMASADVAARENVAREIDALLHNTREAELPNALVELGCCYEPRADGVEPAAWLRHVAIAVRRG